MCAVDRWTSRSETALGMPRGWDTEIWPGGGVRGEVLLCYASFVSLMLCVMGESKGQAARVGLWNVI